MYVIHTLQVHNTYQTLSCPSSVEYWLLNFTLKLCLSTIDQYFNKFSIDLSVSTFIVDVLRRGGIPTVFVSLLDKNFVYYITETPCL